MFSSACQRGILALSAGVSFTPQRLFAAGEQGGWWDPSDFSTMFQDNLGATPVTATGQTVGLIRDKSGRANHASQATAGFRPTLQQDSGGFYYLSFDGVDDFLSTSAIDFTGTNKVTNFVGVRKLSDATTQTVYQLSVDATLNAGSFLLNVPAAAGLYRARFAGTAFGSQDSGAVAAPATSVVTTSADIAAPIEVVRLNGAGQVSTAATLGTGNFGNFAFYLGSFGAASGFFSGRIYSLIVRGAASSAAEIGLAERFVGAKSGIAI